MHLSVSWRELPAEREMEQKNPCTAEQANWTGTSEVNVVGSLVSLGEEVDECESDEEENDEEPMSAGVAKWA